MAEDLHFQGTTKAAIYLELLPQLKALIGNEKNSTANLANITAALKTAFDFFWVGFYLVDNTSQELVLGPFQGPVACTRIQFGKGVCGAAWKQAQTILVDDVEKFPGHIACSSLSKSEIVVPILKNEKVIGVLDVDSSSLANFDETDSIYLTKLCAWLSELV
ncbi:MAG: GAF domain-containing protein [Crocinitomicaceae bacterium]|nr:GAF domain-containing protein [Crocinitomicaceae bacterium]